MTDTTKLLGAECADRITGFAGIATGVAAYLNGTEQVLIESRTPTGDAKQRWVDSCRVVMADDGPAPGVFL